MEYQFLPMQREYADEIAFQWKYDGIYAFYDMTADKDDLREFLDEERWGEEHFAVFNERNELAGYCSYTFEEGIMWIGFGLKPSLTGKGLGAEFIKSGISYGVSRFGYTRDHVMLAVAAFNARAIKVYEKAGFLDVKRYMQNTNGGEYEFVRMKKTL